MSQGSRAACLAGLRISAHSACPTSHPHSASLIQIISDVPPSPGQRFRDANIISSTVCSLSNYQPAAAFPAAAPGGIKRCYLQLLPTHTSPVLTDWRRLPKQGGQAGATLFVLKLIPKKPSHELGDLLVGMPPPPEPPTAALSQRTFQHCPGQLLSQSPIHVGTAEPAARPPCAGAQG